MKLLIVEDDINIGMNIKEYMEEHWFEADLESDWESWFNAAKSWKHDIMIFDIMLPKKNGISITKDIRKLWQTTPIIMLTAKDSIDSRVKWLNSWADDYIVKPFSLKELLARVKSMVRRLNKSENNSNIIHTEWISINLDTREIFRWKLKITLTKKEYQIIELLFKNKNKVLSKKEIEEKIWGKKNKIASDVVRSHMQVIRSKLWSKWQKIIKTVHGVWFKVTD
jgi:DNA-binding response OmpR family regulator